MTNPHENDDDLPAPAPPDSTTPSSSSTTSADSTSDRRGHPTSRRSLLAGLGVAGVGGLAGCLGFELQSSSASNREPALPDDLPNAVYYPTHTEGMEMTGMASDGPYKAALMYTWPHRFWTITGRETKRVAIQDGDSAHLMTVVWHAESGLVTPDVSPTIRVRQDGDQVVSNNPWPMLSQPMGFHFGDNVQLPGEGEYQVEVSIGEPSGRRTGSLTGAGRATFEFTMPFEQSKLESLRFTDVPEAREGTRGAVPGMEMETVPSTTVPEADAIPGSLGGTGSSGDADVVVTVLDDATPFGGGEDERYLAVSPRTPYNQYMLPLMSLSAAVARGSETVYDDTLRSTVDTDLSAHYGTVIPGAESGDQVTVTVDAPPQVSRHEGYERAFVEMGDVSVTL